MIIGARYIGKHIENNTNLKILFFSGFNENPHEGISIFSLKRNGITTQYKLGMLAKHIAKVASRSKPCIKALKVAKINNIIKSM